MVSFPKNGFTFGCMNHETRGLHLCIPLKNLFYITSALPLFGFIFCIMWSLLFHFDETTATHCNVQNYLPSISAAIGNHTIPYAMWCLVITLHAPARFLFLIMYNQCLFKNIFAPDRLFFSNIIALFNLMEILSLLGLTYFTSANFYEYHEKFFITFMASSQIYMLFTCLALKFSYKDANNDSFEAYSLKMKVRLLIVNFLSFIIAGYFFVWHNKSCIPGVYTLFAFFEYVVVLSNIGFHLTAALDFREEYVILRRTSIHIR